MSHLMIHIASNLLLVCVLVSGCLPTGFQENPIARTIGWFSYVGGKDIRETCTGEKVDRFRFVYNAIYSEQVRTYDFMFSSLEESVDLISRVVQLAPYLQIVWNAPLAHWEGVVGRIPVVSVDFNRLKEALRDSSFWRPAPVGLRLRSDTFYWAVSACENGLFQFNVSRAPDEAFQEA
tara:strand:+ start:7745 stop:8278 length:534 start_codon:yes stop_codon:yes gene_type:complete